MLDGAQGPQGLYNRYYRHKVHGVREVGLSQALSD
jgi:hypothetical protein